MSVNLNGDQWDVERVVGEVEESLLHVGKRLGGELLGGTLFEEGPGYLGPTTCTTGTRSSSSSSLAR